MHLIQKVSWPGKRANEISGCYDRNWKKAPVLCSEAPLPLKQSFPYSALSKWLEVAEIVRQTHSCERRNFKTCNTGWRTPPWLARKLLSAVLHSWILHNPPLALPSHRSDLLLLFPSGVFPNPSLKMSTPISVCGSWRTWIIKVEPGGR